MKHGTVGNMAILSGLSLLLSSTQAATSSTDTEHEDSASQGTWRLQLAGLTRSDAGSGESAYSLSTGALEVHLGSLFVAAKVLDFDWSDGGSFVSSPDGRDPWNRFYHVDVGLRRRGALAPALIYEATAGITTEFEDELSDAQSGYIGAYGAYQINPVWTVFAGGFYSRHRKVETDFDLVPILGLSWNAEARDGLSIRVGLPATGAAWHFSKATSLALSLDIGSEECGIYRLADDSEVRPKGYGAFSGAGVTLRFETPVHKDTTLGIGITRTVNREFALYDEDGGNEETVEVEEAIGFTFSLSRCF